MNRSRLKEIIKEQNSFRKPADFYKRVLYREIQPFKENDQAIIISGIRRCGKSTLLQILRHESDEADYFLNFEDDRLIDFKVEDFQMMLEVFIELYGLQKTFWFDEIQNILEWERFIRRIQESGNKVYITGSNAAMFSKELGTRLTGRYLRLEMYPYSFREFVEHHDKTLLKQDIYTTTQKGLIFGLFAKYCELGGIPEYVKLKQIDYLHTLYEGVVYRDIIVRYKLTNERAIKELVYYLASSIGKEISYNSLKKTLGLGSPTTVSEYCGHLETSYLCFFLNRFSHSLKKQLQYNKKCYFVDHAFARALGFRNSQDKGRLLENIVFVELKRRREEIYFHKENKECDFLIRRRGKIEQAIQVCLQLEDKETFKREVDGLVEAMLINQLEKGFILTESQEEIIEKDGLTIFVLPVWKWLLDQGL